MPISFTEKKQAKETARGSTIEFFLLTLSPRRDFKEIATRPVHEQKQNLSFKAILTNTSAPHLIIQDLTEHSAGTL